MMMRRSTQADVSIPHLINEPCASGGADVHLVARLPFDLVHDTTLPPARVKVRPTAL